jgi:uncharacterized protein
MTASSGRSVSRHLVLKVCALAILAVATVAPASAIDCSRATSAVETLICADKDLLKWDEGFNRGYSDLIDRLDARQRRELIESEMHWLVQRDLQCQAKPAADAVDCIIAAMSRRRDELAKKYSDGVRFGAIRLGQAGQTVMVGHERLDLIRARDDMVSLVHGNTLIAEALAFEIDGRGGDDSGEAIVVSTYDGGNLGCADQYLISSLPSQPLRVEALGGRDACWLSFSVKTNGNRLELRTPVAPGRDGLFSTWSAKSGLVVELGTEFVPRRGTTMADFHGDGPPTDNEEFYNSLKRMAPRDWRPMARALQFASVGENDKYVLMSACSGRRGCPDENALAAYAKASKTLFFAYELSGSKYKEDHAQQIIYYPDRAQMARRSHRIRGRMGERQVRDECQTISGSGAQVHKLRSGGCSNSSRSE